MEHEHNRSPERPAVAAWGYPLGTWTMHAIVELGDVRRTACGGTWSSGEPAVIFVGSTVPTQWPRCRACCEAVGVPHERPAYVAPPGVMLDFDMPDEGER